jgi:peptide/nickel transport system substrate-binding protein
VDLAKRNATIAKIWRTLADEQVYIALHHQMLAYAMKNDLDIPVSPENQVHMKFVAAK